MKWSTFLSLAIMVFLLSSCATNYRIISDYEKNVDFSSYHTFQVLNHKDGFPLGANPINKQRFKRAISQEMNSLGFVEDQRPDLIVAWFVKVREVQTVDVYHNYYRQWDYHRPIELQSYQEGTLVIDLIDAKRKKVIWHGKTSDQVYAGMPDVEEKIKAVVEAMFDKYAEDVKNKMDYVVR